MTRISKSILAIALILTASASYGQGLSTEVVVDRTLETSLPEASPMKNVVPQLLSASTNDVSLRPADYSLMSNFAPLVANTHLSPYTGLKLNDYKGYAWLGYFPVYNLGFGAGYSLLRTQRTNAGAALEFNGFSYNNRPTDTGVHSNDIKLQAYASHSLSNGAHLKFDILYGHDGLKNPGLSTGQDKQNINRFDLKACLSRYREDGYYDVALRYNLFGVTREPIFGLDGLTQHRLLVDATMMSSVDSRIMAGMDFSAQLHSGAKTQGLFSLTPKADFKTDIFEASLGVNLAIGIHGDGAYFRASPDVKALLKLFDKAAVYAHIGGGSRISGNADLFDYSPFAVGTIGQNLVYSPLDAKAGVRLGSFEGFSADVFAGYSIVRDTPMPVAGPGGSYSSMVFAATDIRGWYGGIGLSYSYSDQLDACVRVALGPEGLTSANGQYLDRAKGFLTARVAYHPTKEWAAEAGFNLRSGRRFHIYDDNGGSTLNAGNIADFNLGGKWNFKENLTFFLRLNNIFNRRPELLPGLSTQGFHGLLGAEYRF